MNLVKRLETGEDCGFLTSCVALGGGRFSFGAVGQLLLEKIVGQLVKFVTSFIHTPRTVFE